MPVEGLGFGIQSNAVLRRAGLTTVGQVRDLLEGNEAGRRVIAAHEGQRNFLRSPFVQQELRAQLAVFERKGPVRFATLTRPETQIRDLIVLGQSTKAIAAKLRINESVLDAQVETAFRKMKGPCAHYGD